MMDFYLGAWKKYAVFSGRAQRAEYWYFALVNGIAYVLIQLVAAYFLGSTRFALAILVIFALVILLPTVGVSVRRLHDTGRSGWWFLFGFIPLIGALVLLYFYVQDSVPGANQYGPSPKSGNPSGMPIPAV